MEFLNLQKPQAPKRLKPGQVLIAEPFLADPNFARAVILICEHGEEGSVGFTLNRPTDLTLGDLLPELYTPNLYINQGGPVQLDTLHMLHKRSEDFGGNEIVPGVFWGGSYEMLQNHLQADPRNTDNVKLFVGYCGWSPGQLEKELEEGSWMVVDLRPELIFNTDPEQVWRKAISHLGREFSYLANMPLNPQLN